MARSVCPGTKECVPSDKKSHIGTTRAARSNNGHTVSNETVKRGVLSRTMR